MPVAGLTELNGGFRLDVFSTPKNLQEVWSDEGRQQQRWQSCREGDGVHRKQRRGRCDRSHRDFIEFRHLPGNRGGGRSYRQYWRAWQARQLNLDKLWAHNITLTTRLVDTVTSPMLLRTVVSGKVKPKQLITHHFALNNVLQAYNTFGNAMKERALKVIITND